LVQRLEIEILRRGELRISQRHTWLWLDRERDRVVGGRARRVDVDPRGWADVEHDRKVRTGRHGLVADIRRHVQMTAADLRPWSRKPPTESRHDAGHGVALLIGVLEETRSDDAPPIDDERARERNAELFTVRFGYRRVQDPVLADHARALVREQRKRDATPFREVGEDRHWVVADRDEAQSRSLDVLQSAL